MGIFNFLFGNKQLMTYQINMNEENTLHIDVQKETPNLTSHEYLRLWAHYHCKIMYNFGYPDYKNEATEALSFILSKIIHKRFDAKARVNCIKRAELDDIITYSKQSIRPIVSFSGEFLTKESNRFIKTYFPYNITEQQVLYSSIGLLQYALDKCSDNQNDLDIAWKIIFFLLVSLNNPERISSGQALTVGVPEIGYHKALEIDINEIISEVSEPSEEGLADRFLKTYYALNSESLSATASRYISRIYPLDSETTEYNTFLRDCFTIGYNIRVTEESFADEFNFSINKIRPNTNTYNFILSDMSKEDKIKAIAEYKEHNNTKCDLGPEVEDYSILGIGLINKHLSDLIAEYLYSNGHREPNDVLVEISARNAAFGYCYKLAEEIVDAY